MENKKQQGGIIAAVILAIILIIALVLCIFFKVQNKKISLSPELDTEDILVETVNEVSTEISQDYDGMIISLNDQTANDNEDVDEEDADNEEELDEEDSGDSDEYICQYSLDRKITSSDWKKLKKKYKNTNFPAGRSLAQMIINEMYARHGYIFDNDEFNEYFSEKSWYEDIEEWYDDMNDITSIMTKTEKDNVKFLKKKI